MPGIEWSEWWLAVPVYNLASGIFCLLLGLANIWRDRPVWGIALTSIGFACIVVGVVTAPVYLERIGWLN